MCVLKLKWRLSGLLTRAFTNYLFWDKIFHRIWSSQIWGSLEAIKLQSASRVCLPGFERARTHHHPWPFTGFWELGTGHACLLFHMLKTQLCFLFVGSAGRPCLFFLLDCKCCYYSRGSSFTSEIHTCVFPVWCASFCFVHGLSAVTVCCAYFFLIF